MNSYIICNISDPDAMKKALRYAEKNSRSRKFKNAVLGVIFALGWIVISEQAKEIEKLKQEAEYKRKGD